MKTLACTLVALSGLALAAPAKADHDYYPARHRYSAHCNCYQCVGYRGYYYEPYRSGYHPRSYFRPYRRSYRPYYGDYYRRGYYPRRGFGFRSRGFSFRLGY